VSSHLDTLAYFVAPLLLEGQVRKDQGVNLLDTLDAPVHAEPGHDCLQLGRVGGDGDVLDLLVEVALGRVGIPFDECVVHEGANQLGA
jgi:hypothetical protein